MFCIDFYLIDVCAQQCIYTYNYYIVLTEF